MSDNNLYKDKIFQTVKSFIRLTLSVVLYYSGIVNLCRYLNRKFQEDRVIKILAYHNIGNGRYLNLDMPEQIFTKQIEYLMQSYYNVISLEEAVDLLQTMNTIPNDTVVITFDDGYKSMYTSLLPLVKKYKFPATIFLSVDPIDNEFPLFVDALVYAIDRTDMESLDLSSSGLKKYSIKTTLLKEKAMLKINEYSKILCNKDKLKLLEFIFKQLNVDITNPELKSKMLSWEEIKEMREFGISFGAHTLSHPVLSQIPIEDAIKEISKSRMSIQKKLDDDIRHFAYPYGSSDSFNNDVAKAVQQNGFLCACSLVPGTIKKGDNLFSLKRTMVANNIPCQFLKMFSKAIFAVQLSGIFDFLRYSTPEKTY